jgi:hypothetical protein
MAIPASLLLWFPNFCTFAAGEMAERSIAAVLKTVVPIRDRGFESLSLREEGVRLGVSVIEVLYFIFQHSNVIPKLLRRDARAVEWGGLENR